MHRLIPTRRTATAIGIAVLLAAPALTAIGPAPLPKANLTTLRGDSTALGSLSWTGSWLILYVRADCGACEGMLRTVESQPEVTQRTIVVVGGADADAVKRLA